MRALFLAFALGLPLASNGSAVADLLTFEEPAVRLGNIPPGYHGLNFENFLVTSTFQTSDLDNSGFAQGTISPTRVAYNANGDPAAISSADHNPFTLNSLYLTGGWNDNLNIHIAGLRNGVAIDSAALTVSTSSPTLLNLNWIGIDTLQFISFGGTPHPGYIGHGTQFAMDDITINEPTRPAPIPEPGSIALVSSGALAILSAARRRFMTKHLRKSLNRPKPRTRGFAVQLWSTLRSSRAGDVSCSTSTSPVGRYPL